MHFTGAELSSLVGSYLWPFFRVSSLFMVIPVIGTRLVPVQIRLLLAILVTAVVVPTLPAVPLVDALSLNGLVMICQQVVIGIAMGFIFQLVLETFVLGAQIIAMQAGLGFASLVDPASGSSVPMVGQLYLMMGGLLFLALNGHLTIIELVVQSFQTLPLGQNISLDSIWRLLSFMSFTFQGAIFVSLPVIISLLVVNLSFGVLTRAAPQLNIFAIGFPITLTIGLLLIYINMSGFLFHFNHSLTQGFQLFTTVATRS